jgi:hypothetical protein
MPVATVRGVDINYEVLGPRGPWVALQAGGRRPTMRRSAWLKTSTRSSSMRRSGAAWKRFAAPSISPK